MAAWRVELDGLDCTLHSLPESHLKLLNSVLAIAHCPSMDRKCRVYAIDILAERDLGRSIGRSVLLFLRSLGEAFLLIDLLLQAPLNPSRSCSPLPPPSLSFFFYSLYVSVVCVEHLAPSERCEPCSPFFFFFFFISVCVFPFLPHANLPRISRHGDDGGKRRSPNFIRLLSLIIFFGLVLIRNATNSILLLVLKHLTILICDAIIVIAMQYNRMRCVIKTVLKESRNDPCYTLRGAISRKVPQVNRRC